MDMVNVVQVGKVSAVDEAKRMVRVIWPASGETSGWLYVLQQSEIWLPKINEAVLVIYQPVEDGDGFVVGRIT